MDLVTFIVCVSIASFCFTTVYWMKSYERKYRLDKTRRVDYFIKKNKLNVNKFYSGYEHDLIHDLETKSVWFFVLRDDRLRYKQVPFEDIYRVEYKLDGVVVAEATRTRQSKRELVGGEPTESPAEMQSFIHLKEDIRTAKEFKLTIFLDDLQATSLDVIFGNYYIPKDLKRLKKNEALEWFKVFKSIINTDKSDWDKTQLNKKKSSV